METMLQAVAQVAPLITMRRPNILFVSDDAGERAWMAAELARRICTLPAAFDATGFEQRDWEERFPDALCAAGLALPGAPVARALDIAFSEHRYDFVVVLSDHGRTGLGGPFCRYINALFSAEAELVHWEVPAFGLRSGSDAEWEDGYLQVQSRITEEVSWLLACLEDALPGAA